MAIVDRQSITDAVIASFALSTPRERQLLEALVRHLHGFVRETALTHAEWAAAVGFLVRCGRICDDRRDEFMLLSDVLGVSSLVDLIDAPEAATEGSVLGPFYASDSPEVAVGADIRPDKAVPSLRVHGCVRDTSGRPLAGALIDMWQTSEQGLYATQDPNQVDDAFRCKMRCSPAGEYGFTTVRPGPYKVPDDGPVGDLLRAGRRTAWRPAHLHFRVSAPGHQPLITEIFFADDEWLQKDAVFGVRASLVQQPRNTANGGDMEVNFDLAAAA
jgi:hydroxyquinol 1,2-dioxygenase